MPNPIVHFEITGQDATKLKAFYSTLFGWNVDSNNPMDYGMVEAQDGHGIGGGITKAEMPGVSGTTIYVEVGDLQAQLDKAVSLGGKVVVPVTEIPGVVTFAVLADPEGHAVGMVKAGSM